jgi:acetyl-CoA acetyltransferase
MKRASEAVIIDAIRTPIGKYAGALEDARPDDIIALILRTLLARSHLDPSLVHEMKHRGAHRGIATMCIGVGQGITTIVEQV